MKRLDKLFLITFFPPFILTFFIALFVLLMQFLWKYVDDMIGKGLELHIIAELLFYASASMVPLALPLAILLSSIMTLGNLGERYELVAVKASGISLIKSMKILFIATFLISIFAFGFSNYYLPYANLKFGTLLYDVRQKRPALNIKEGVFYNEIEGYSIKIDKKDKDNKTIHNIIIYDHTSGRGNDNVTIAKRGEMYTAEDDQYLTIKLYDGWQYLEMPSKNPNKPGYEHLQTKFDRWEKILDLSSFNLTRIDESFFKDHYEMLNITQLEAALDSIKMKIEKRSDKLAGHISSFYYFTNRNIDSINYTGATDNTGTKFTEQFSDSIKKIVYPNASQSIRSVHDLISFAQRDYSIQHNLFVRHQIEWHRKFTLSIACLLLFLIGAPLGAIIRKGGLGWPLVLATLIFILYHIVSITGEKFARQEVLPPYQGMWMSSIALLPISLFLIYKIAVDPFTFKKPSIIKSKKIHTGKK